MTRHFSDDERRARLGRAHLLAASGESVGPEGVARALTGIHSTDPTSTVLGILARSPGTTLEDIERALYDDRTLVRVLGMRRTLFAVDYTLAPPVWASFDSSVVRNQRTLLVRALESTGVTQTEAWIEEARRRLLAFLSEHPGSTSSQISADDPYLGLRFPLTGPGVTDASQSAASRLLTLMSAEGSVVRSRPKGSWTSSQFTWTTTNDWRSDWPDRPSQDDADTLIARSWLAAYGPGTLEDLAWWMGWPKGRSRKAIDRAGGIEVSTNEGAAFVLPDDLEIVSSPPPWVALLPGLDSSTMGWKRRDFYLGPHGTEVFDNVGNGGPTVWVDGRIVGGWAHRDSGEIAFELFVDVGQEARAAIERRAEGLQVSLGAARIKPRARRYTASEQRLK